MSSSARAQRVAAAQEAAKAQLAARMAAMKRLSAQEQQRRNGRPQLLQPSMHRFQRFQHNRELPLHLLLLITAWLDDVGDLARLLRVSKLLYYIVLPKLWENVTLRSYSEIRYKDGLPEGYGSGSPFCMGLEALVSRNVAAYVKTLRLVGEWREVDGDEFSKGRVPDNTMLLNVAVRAALDKCVKLESFSWELNVKPLKSLYQGLAARPTLRSLTLRFPSKRIPRPTSVIPPIPNLRYLYIYDLDPLCYPDDISLLLLSCTKLEDLKLEWSPRMRREKEPSVHVDSYFGRAAAAGVKLPPKRLALKNLYARNNSEHTSIFAFDRLESVTFLNCVNLDDPSSIFFDSTWQMHSPDWSKMSKMKKLRTDAVDRRSADFLTRLQDGLEEVYIVSRNSHSSQTSSPSTQNGNGSLDAPTPETPTQPPTPSRAANPSLAGDYIAALTSHHGPTLRILLLSDQWSLGDEVIKLIVRSCPNLEQLAAAIEGLHFATCRQTAGRLPKLWALRVLHPGGAEDRVVERLRVQDQWAHMEQRGLDMIGKEVWKEEYRNIKYFALGMQFFEFGKVVRLSEEREDGERTMKRIVKQLKWDEIKDKCEIFGMDSQDI